MTQNKKSRGIVKQYNRKALKKMQQAAMKGYIIILITQKTDTSDLSDTQSYFNEASL